MLPVRLLKLKTPVCNAIHHHTTLATALFSRPLLPHFLPTGSSRNPLHRLDHAEFTHETAPLSETLEFAVLAHTYTLQTSGRRPVTHYHPWNKPNIPNSNETCQYFHRLHRKAPILSRSMTSSDNAGRQKQTHTPSSHASATQTGVTAGTAGTVRLWTERS